MVGVYKNGHKSERRSLSCALRDREKIPFVCPEVQYSEARIQGQGDQEVLKQRSERGRPLTGVPKRNLNLKSN